MKLFFFIFLKCFWFCFLIGNFSLLAQSPEGGKVKGMKVCKFPKVYDDPIGKIYSADLESATGDKNWLVYSDRDSNTTFLNRNCTGVYKTINFMEAFWVVGVSGNSIRIVKPGMDCTEGSGKLKIKSDACDYGWISKNNMLIWSEALVDSSTKFSIKALSIRTPRDLKSRSFTKKVLHIYSSPELNNSLNKDVNIFDFLYVYKKDGNAILLGKNVNMEKADMLDMLGWVNKDNIVEWKHVICLEPNMDLKARGERVSKDIPISFFEEAANAKEFEKIKKGDSIRKALPYTDPAFDKTESFDQLEAYEKRSPILDTLKGDHDIIKTGFVTNSLNKDGVSIFSSHWEAILTKKMNRVRDNYRKIRIVFVIDGSDSAKNFYEQGIISAINNSMDLMKNSSNNDFQLGAVIYNDYGCESLTDEIQMTPTIERFITELKKIRNEKHPCITRQQRDKGSPLFYALSEATGMFQDETNTNIIMLIGTSSNYKSDTKGFTREKIIDQLAKNNCSFLGYMIINNHTPAYQDFLRDCKEMINLSAGKIDKEIKMFRKNKKNPDEPHLESSPKNPYVFNLVNSSVKGKFVYSPKNFVKQTLASEIENLVNAIIEEHGKTLDEFERWLRGNPKSDRSKAAMELIKRLGISDADLEQIDLNERFQLFIQSYTSIKCNDLNSPLFKKVIFLNENEFNNLYEQFQKLVNACKVGSCTEIQDALEITYRKIAESYISNRAARGKINKMTTGAIHSMITGLPQDNEFLRKIQINKIHDIPCEDVSNLCNYFKCIKSNLDGIFNDDKKYSYRVDRRVFYWIREDAFDCSK